MAANCGAILASTVTALRAFALASSVVLGTAAFAAQPKRPDPFPNTLVLRPGEERRYRGYSIYMPDPLHVDGSSQMTFEGQILVVKALKPGKQQYKLSAYGSARRGDLGWKKVKVEVTKK